MKMKKIMPILLSAAMLFCMSGKVSAEELENMSGKGIEIADSSEVRNQFAADENTESDIEVQSASETETLFNVDGVQYKVLDESSVALWDASDVSGSYEIPSQVTYDNATYSVKEIGYRAFYKNENLTAVTMPDTITKIQDGNTTDEGIINGACGAFGECKTLKTVDFSKNLSYLGKWTFYHDKTLSNVILPEKLETIMDEAFGGCSGITKLELPASVTDVGQCALSGTSLAEFTIPKTCVNFHDWALDDISTLTSIYVEPGQGSFCSEDGVMYTLGMSWIACYPEGKMDKQFKIPDGVTTIRSGVFGRNKFLEKLILNSRIGQSGLGTAILQRTNISVVEVPADNPYLKSVDGVLFSKDGKTLILYPPNKADSVYFIPSGTINIGNEWDYTFEFCKNLEELYIPSSVEKIEGIMWYSDKLKQVVFASKSKITSLPGFMFQGCKALENICLPASVNTLSDDFYGNEFLDCENLNVFYAAPGAGIYNCEYFGCQTLSCGQLTIYGEGSSNALSRLAEQFDRPYQDVSQSCDRVLGITFQDTVQSVVKGESKSLNTVIYPSIKSDEVLTYTSSDESIAVVDANGNVKGIQEGTCYITASSQDGAYARCQIQVENKQQPAKWIKSGNRWWYRYSDGSYPKNEICQIGKSWYCFDAQGWMKTGWQYKDKNWYYFKADGAMQTGWLLEKGTWYYLNADGTMAKGWKYVNKMWYYFQDNGAMQTGWLTEGGSRYYLNADGKMETGLLTVEDANYYFNASGKMRTGWLKLNEIWYYFKSDGKMAVNGWQKIGGKWYYMDKNGAMQESRWISGTYYVKADGSMAVSEWVDQDRYYVDANGKWVKDKVKEA